MSTESIPQFEELVTAYHTACYSVDLPSKQREAAASRFREWVSTFGREKIQALVSMLSSEDSRRRNTAARVLVELPVPEALTGWELALELIQSFPLHLTVLNEVGKATPFPDELWAFISTTMSPSLLPLISGALSRPTEPALSFFEQALASDNVIIKRYVIKAAAEWHEPALLWNIVKGPPLIPTAKLPSWMKQDARLDAAFHLGLNGDQQATQYLEAVTTGHDMAQVAQATLHLAWLARPEAVAPVARLLRSTVLEDAGIKGLALNAAETLSTAALGPTLLYVARELEAAIPGFPPLSDDAIRILGRLTGQLLPDHMVGYAAKATIETFTKKTRQQAVHLYEQALSEFVPSLRYYQGEPLDLKHLVEQITSIHAGPKQTASYNLRAITGENYGFDLDADLIANLSAIEAWRRRASQSGLTEPGSWVFHGMKLPNPSAVAD